MNSNPVILLRDAPTPVDWALVEALRALEETPHASSECGESMSPIIVEALIWISVTTIAWIFISSIWV